jgi:hypothetical protein
MIERSRVRKSGPVQELRARYFDLELTRRIAIPARGHEQRRTKGLTHDRIRSHVRAVQKPLASQGASTHAQAELDRRFRP